MSDYDFYMPYPPSVNGYWRTYKNRQIISERGRSYRSLAIRTMKNLNLDNEGLSDRLRVTVTIHPPTLRKYDIDNWCKAPFDALTHAKFWIDDEQVDKLEVLKGEKIKGGLIRVRVYKLD